MKNFIKKHPIQFIIICIAAFGAILLFCCSYYNHNSVNNNCQIHIKNISISFKEIKACVDVIKDDIKSESITKDSNNNIINELNTILYNIEKDKNEISKQYQNMFDANTVTFLITFLSALFFTLFLTYIIYNVEQYCILKNITNEYRAKINDANEKITIADNKIAEVNKEINEVDNRIAGANITWCAKLQNLEEILNLVAERNNLIQILNLVSVLGSHLASSNYVIQNGHVILVYMVLRKVRDLFSDKFKNIKNITLKEKTEFMGIISDCITYLNIDTLRDCNTCGLIMFEQLNDELLQIQYIIKNIPLKEEY